MAAVPDLDAPSARLHHGDRSDRTVETTAIGWVQQAYGEIDEWNRQPGNQLIRCLALYRWPRIDKWFIDGKQGVIDDFLQALAREYRWRFTAAR